MCIRDSITLQEEDDGDEVGDGNKALTEAFHKLMNQLLQVIYNINAKTQDLYATHISIIGTIAGGAGAGESKKKNKKKTAAAATAVAAAVDEASANKKTKYE